MSTIKRGLKQASNLLSNKNFEGNLWYKETWWKSLGILNSSLNISFRKILKGVYLFDWLHENAVENVIDTGTSQALDSALLNKFTFDHFTVWICESVDQVQNDRALVTLDRIAVNIKLDKLYFFVLEKLVYLSR